MDWIQLNSVEMSWPAEQLSASQEELCSMESSLLRFYHPVTHFLQICSLFFHSDVNSP
jgi:hypothetical protein